MLNKKSCFITKYHNFSRYCCIYKLLFTVIQTFYFFKKVKKVAHLNEFDQEKLNTFKEIAL